MRRLYRESHYANGTTESGGERAGLYQCARARAGRTSARRTRMRRAGSREEERTSERATPERRRHAGERITHNLTEGRGADPAKKAAAQLFHSVLSPPPSPPTPPPLSALSALLFAMLIPCERERAILAMRRNFASLTSEGSLSRTFSCHRIPE